MKKPGRPATGRARPCKLHLWISSTAARLLARYCEAFQRSKTEAIETLIFSSAADVSSAEQDER